MFYENFKAQLPGSKLLLTKKKKKNLKSNLRTNEMCNYRR